MVQTNQGEVIVMDPRGRWAMKWVGMKRGTKSRCTRCCSPYNGGISLSIYHVTDVGSGDHNSVTVRNVNGVLKKGCWGLVAPVGARGGDWLIEFFVRSRRDRAVLAWFWQDSYNWEICVLICGQVDDWWRWRWGDEVDDVRLRAWGCRQWEVYN